MAQIWMDEENTSTNLFPRSSRKVLGDTAISQSGVKSVLGKLDNVMYNKPNTTPFKGAQGYTKWPVSCAPKISLCKETLEKQHRKQLIKDNPHLKEDGLKTPQLQITHQLHSQTANANFDLYDFMDFPNENCLKNCCRPIAENWLEPLSDEFVNQLLNNSVDTDDNVNNEIPLHPDLNIDPFELKPVDFQPDFEDNLSNILDASVPMPIIYDDLDLL